MCNCILSHIRDSHWNILLEAVQLNLPPLCLNKSVPCNLGLVNGMTIIFTMIPLRAIRSFGCICGEKKPLWNGWCAAHYALRKEMVLKHYQGMKEDACLFFCTSSAFYWLFFSFLLLPFFFLLLWNVLNLAWRLAFGFTAAKMPTDGQIIHFIKSLGSVRQGFMSFTAWSTCNSITSDLVSVTHIPTHKPHR